MQRIDKRRAAELRDVSFEPNFAPYAEGSTLICMGSTKVICAATVEEGVPRWMLDEGKVGGWITAEYSMLPRATLQRVRRERQGISGRSQEIQRLIGRALRAAVDLTKLGQRMITIDCDVIQADGGTRTASITGGYVALVLAIKKLIAKELVPADCLLSPVAAISAGVVNGVPILDLCYEEDSKAEIDANFVMNAEGEIIEVQGTAEGQPIKKENFDLLFDLSKEGIKQLISTQQLITSKV